MMCKHVDDLKMGGKKKILEDIIAAIEHVFGKLTKHWENVVESAIGISPMVVSQWIKTIISKTRSRSVALGFSADPLRIRAMRSLEPCLGRFLVQ